MFNLISVDDVDARAPKALLFYEKYAKTILNIEK